MYKEKHSIQYHLELLDIYVDKLCILILCYKQCTNHLNEYSVSIKNDGFGDQGSR